jgi:CRISPR/Cas system-associated exonuclease Cas4 (RecB family)
MVTVERALQSSNQDNATDSPGQSGVDVGEIIESLSPETFDNWYREREFAENIRNGTSYFNGPKKVKPPEKHSPSSLLKCHRKVTYKQLNAPAETPEPTGIFWIGSQFEEEVALPYLRQAVTGASEYVTNSLWVNFTVQTDAGELQIKGETDPVIVDADADPLLLTEIKTRESVEDLERPSRHHRAQAHAYMKGLSETHERNITDAIILYGGRTNFDIRVFHVPFDPVFWSDTITTWAERHTNYRLEEELPPAEPEYSWECGYCPYQERCGKGALEYSDIGATGFLPGMTEYPKQQVVEHLEGHDEATLTPTLAWEYPDIAETYEVDDWVCEACSSRFEWKEIEPDAEQEAVAGPQCPSCSYPDARVVGLAGLKQIQGGIR